MAQNIARIGRNSGPHLATVRRLSKLNQADGETGRHRRTSQSAGLALPRGAKTNVQTTPCGQSPRGLKIRFILPSSSVVSQEYASSSYFPFSCENVPFWRSHNSICFRRRVPPRPAIFRAWRRCGSAALGHCSNRRGAWFHRIASVYGNAISSQKTGDELPELNRSRTSAGLFCTQM